RPLRAEQPPQKGALEAFHSGQAVQASAADFLLLNPARRSMVPPPASTASDPSMDHPVVLSCFPTYLPLFTGACRLDLTTENALNCFLHQAFQQCEIVCRDYPQKQDQAYI